MKKLKGIAAFLGAALGLQCLTLMPAMQVSAATLLVAEFETTNDSFSARGSAEVQWLQDEAYTENCSLFVSKRGAAWAGAVRDVSSLLSAGSTYSVSAAVKQKSGAAVDMKISLQYSAGGTTSYADVAVGSVPSDEWTVLSNEDFQVPAGASGMQIYVETTNDDTDFIDFYLDTFKITGSPASIKKGDANGDMFVNIADAVALVKFLTTQSTEIEEGADMDGNGKINAADLSLLKAYLLNPPAGPAIEGSWDDYQETADAKWLKVYQDGLYRVGNTARIRDKIAKAQAGEPITLGYIGGSITEGGSASSPSNYYVTLASEYFSTTFGKGGNVKYVNAGLAGTSSVVGNIRVDKDIFAKNCDVIFIEYAVNDQGGDRFQKSYESLVKKCLMQPNEPAVILITLSQKSGSSNQDWMVKVGENYDLAVISGKNAVANLNWDSEYGSGDTIHPGNGGHKMIADCISYYFRQALRSENASDSYELPSKEVFGADYATSELVDMSKLPNFNAGSWNPGTNNREYGGYTYSKNGNNPMTFSTEGKGILLLFQSNSSNMGSVNVTVNGKTNKVTSQLQWTWGGLDGDCGYYQPNSGPLDVSISSADGGTFVLYGIAVIK